MDFIRIIVVVWQNVLGGVKGCVDKHSRKRELIYLNNYLRGKH